MGHVLLRNDSAGVDEQLIEGKNGYLIRNDDVKGFAKAIEKIVNKKTSNKELQKMGITSQAIIKPYASHKYLEGLDLPRHTPKS